MQHDQAPAAVPARAAHRWPYLHLIGAGVVLAYFLVFVSRGLGARFAADDMMNIYHYWSRGPWSVVKGLVLFFSAYYRPMGGVFYESLYHWFGLNPLPYHIVITLLLLLNTYLAYRCALLLSGSALLAGLSALMVAYHPQLAQLVYLPSFIYDVLCFAFFFLALNYYLSIRQRGQALGWKQVTAFLLFYVGALDSKEMAVTLPVVVLLYEAIWHRPDWRSRDVLRWARGEALPALIAGAMTAVYIIGKSLGPDSLMRIDAYQPVFTWNMYASSTARFLNNLFCQPILFGFFRSPAKVLATWAVLIYVASRLKRRHFWLAVWFVILTPLPITFIPGRGGAQLYIPLLGWAIVLATLFLGLCEVVAREPLFRRLPAQLTRGALVVLGVALFWHEIAHQNGKVIPELDRRDLLTESIIQQLREIQPRVPPHSKVVFLNNVFRDYDVFFIAALTYRDPTVRIWLLDKTPLPEKEVQAMDYIFRFDNQKLVRLKPPM
jgi:hypothetical protein